MWEGSAVTPRWQLKSRKPPPRKIRVPFQTRCGAELVGSLHFVASTTPVRMSDTNPLSLFHHWRLASTEPPCPSRTVVLHGGSAELLDPLIDEIAEYLNEYDADDAGRWLAATSDLVLRISASMDSRKLLGMADPCPNCPPDSACGVRATLAALGRHGHVVFRAEAPKGKSLDLPVAFHAGIGQSDCGCGNCHLVLNPDLVQPRSIAHIVSDVFLDWHHESSHPASGPAIRNAPSSGIQEQTGSTDVASF
jgi:hypothetical protein